MAEAKPEFILRTQETLGAIIKKPPLSDKLLSKPPFRFLHDVVTTAIKTTGFAAQLYSEEEMNSDSVSDKDAKMAFLQKLLDLLQLMLDEPLSAKPAKIVAGQEPEKTNELLQALARAIKLQSDSASYVQRILNGEKPNVAGKKAKPVSVEAAQQQTSSDGSAGSNKENRATTNEKKPQSRKRSESSEKKSRKGAESELNPTETDKRKEKSKQSTQKNDSVETAAVTGDKPHSKKSKEGHSTKEVDGTTDGEQRKKKRTIKQRDNAETDHATANEANSEKKTDPTRKKKTAKAEITEKSKRQEDHTASNGQIAEQQDNAKNQPPTELSEDKSFGVRPSSAMPRPGTAAGGLRPSTARIAPPRVRRNELPQKETAATAARVSNDSSLQQTANIITAVNDANEKPSEENFIVEESAFEALRNEGTGDTTNGGLLPHNGLEEDHGGLVRRILETKKELESGLRDMQEAKAHQIYDAKERERTAKETSALQEHIQTLTCASHPLGKIMDYLQEDVDTIVRELEQWRGEYRQNVTRLRQEQSAASSETEPLKAKLTELEQQIKEQLDVVGSIKSDMLEKEDRIGRCMVSITKK